MTSSQRMDSSLNHRWNDVVQRWNDVVQRWNDVVQSWSGLVQNRSDGNTYLYYVILIVSPPAIFGVALSVILEFIHPSSSKFLIEDPNNV